MPDKWLSIAAAAASLNVHTRTIERRIAGAKIESRRADDGQVQVLINVPDEPIAMPDPLETVKELAQDQVSLATGSASAIVRLAQNDAERARGELALVREEADRVRRGGRLAWGAVAAMAAAVCMAVGWTTHRVTRADGEIAELHRVAEQTEQASRQLLIERDAARQDAQAARLAGADSTGRLAAYVEQAQIQARRASDKRPTTQPANLIQRLATAIVGD